MKRLDRNDESMRPLAWIIRATLASLSPAPSAATHFHPQKHTLRPYSNRYLMNLCLLERVHGRHFFILVPWLFEEEAFQLKLEESEIDK